MTFTLGIHDTTTPPLAPSSIGPQVLTDFTAAGSPGIATAFSNEWKFLGVNTTYMDISGPLVFTNPASITGTLALLTPPVNTSVLIDKRTGSGGRRNRGRMFVPCIFPNEGDIDVNGIILAADVTTMQTKWTSFFNALTGHLLLPTLYHQTAPFSGTTITSFVVQNKVATQRRRLRR